MVTLCENCFPDWGYYEVYCNPPLLPCEQCGKFDNRKDVICHTFPRDPRPKQNKGEE